MSVAVVIGNYQGADLLPDCLDSLAAQTLAPAEVIVCDAGSTDASLEVARARGARVLALENRGLGYLYNRGAEASSADYLLVANNDVALEPRCLEELAAALDADESRFAADPTQLDWSGSTVIHAWTTLRRGPLLHTALPGFELAPAEPAEDVVPTVFANAGAMLVRRSQLLALGGFDERYFMEYEDIDLCWRAWLRGWPSVYVPAAVLRHHVGGATGASDLPRRLRSSHRNLLRFALKCLPAGAAARVVAAELVRAAVHRGPVAGGVADALRDLPDILRQRRAVAPRRDVLERLLDGPR